MEKPEEKTPTPDILTQENKDNKTIIKETVIEKHISTDLTDSDIFNKIRPKLEAKYGKETIDIIQSDYNKGIKYDSSIEENMIDSIKEKADIVFKDMNIIKKENEVYDSFNLSREEGIKQMSEFINSETWIRDMVKQNPEIANKPGFIKEGLSKYRQMQADKNMIHNFGSPNEQYNMEERENEILKKGLNVTEKEKKEYEQILLYKLNQK